MTKKNKHKKNIQVLIIPDDKDEPKAFSFPVARLKFFKVLAVVLIIHILVGIFSYYQFYRIYKKNVELVETNKILGENNKKIYQLASAFSELENSQTKIRAALGLGSINSPQLMVEEPQEQQTLVPSVMPVVQSTQEESNVSGEVIREKLGFLKRSKSSLHDYEKSVPTFLPVEGILTSDYDQGVQQSKRTHRGIDIAAARGSFVHSAADGIVVFAGWTYDLGNLLILYHGSGFFTYYGHNQRLLVTRNSLVKKGDVISLLGNSGHSSAPHLHFEIWKDGIPLDPKDYLFAFSGL